MEGFYRFGVKVSRFSSRVALFFSFLKSLVTSFKALFRDEHDISFFPLLKSIYFFGVRLSFLVFLLSALMAIGLSITAHFVFSPYNLQNKALSISEGLILEDLLPALLGLMIGAQSALSVIRIHEGRFFHVEKGNLEKMQIYLLFMMAGMMIASVLLYPYAYLAVYLGVYTTFHYFLPLSSHYYLFEPGYSVPMLVLVTSMMKSFLFGTLIAFVSGFFHYHLLIGRMTLQQTVSSIFSRSLFWLVFSNVVWKCMHL